MTRTVEHNRRASSQPYFLKLGTLSLIAAFVVLIAKLWLIDQYGNVTPFWDQWKAEANLLYRPWLEGNLQLIDLFSGHNEHRILTTRLLNLLIFEASAHLWNPILQMRVNAALHCVALLLLLYLLGYSLKSRQQIIFIMGAVAVLCIPLGWENSLAGFQSQFYFLLLFSVIYLWAMSTLDVCSWRWWAAQTLGFLSVFSLASGALTLICGALIIVVREFHSSAIKKYGLVAAMLLVAVAAVAIATTPHIPVHEALKADSVAQFWRALKTATAWPAKRKGVNFIIVQLPLACLLWKMLRDRNWHTPGHYFIAAIGLWVWGQLASTAFSRADGVLASRYADLFVVGLIVGLASALLLLEAARYRQIAYAGLAIWLFTLAHGMTWQIERLQSDLQIKHAQSLTQEHNVRQYLCTGDSNYLFGKPQFDIPYDDATYLKATLDNPTVRGFIPAPLFRCDLLDKKTFNNHHAPADIKSLNLAT